MISQAETNVKQITIEKTIRISVNALLLLTPIVAAYIVFILLSNANKGFDITDEGYYLISATQATAISLSASQFGHYTGLLFSLVDEDIPLFRQSGLLILLLVAAWFSLAMQSYWNRYTKQHDKFLELTRHIVITTSASGYYCEWMLTPSYNWSTLLAVLLAIIALLTSSIHQPGTRKQGAYLVLLGISGALAFLNKPPSAIILAFTAITWLLLHPKDYNYKSYFLVSSLSALVFLLFHTLIFDHHILATANEMKKSATLSGLLQAGHTIPAAFERLWEETPKILRFTLNKVPFLFILLPLVFWLIRGFHLSDRRRSVLITGYSCLLLLDAWFTLYDQNIWNRLSSGAGYATLFLLGLLLFFLNSSENQQSVQRSIAIAKPMFSIQALLILTAIAFVFGTGRSTIGQLSLVSILPVTSVLYSCHASDLMRHKRILFPLALIFSVLSLFLVIISATSKPYRIVQSLEQQVVPVEFNNNNWLLTDLATAAYVSGLKEIAADAGWQPGNLLIDMTGGTPGASFILNAKTLPTPWLLGGYKGSRDFTSFVLQAVPKDELEQAWILIAPQGKRRNDLSVLNEVGLDFPDNYEEVGPLLTGHRHELQILLKPKIVAE
ncbi:MAG: hypothetical protein PVG66_03745 [Chromatiales bacterium]